jgi:histidinol dehydrogenase
MEVLLHPPRKSWPEILARPAIDYSGLRTTVMEILDDVRSGGDKSVREFNRRFDAVETDDLKVSTREIESALKAIPDDLKEAIDKARKNIEKFHAGQKVEESLIYTSVGVKCWTRIVPVERVGLYIPGGTAPLLSTVLMLGIPARLAGCEKIVLCTPPGPGGKIHPAILYTAHLLGIDMIFRAGGAQAIAAMAYGTGSIPAVDKIFGPGNPYVTVAKQLVSLDGVAIDMPAGPSEVAVIADESADPAFIAADLIAQAEHGRDSQVLLVTSSEGLAGSVQHEISKQLDKLPRKEIASASIEKSRIIILENQDEVIDLVNMYAPEHLIIMCRDYGEAGIRIKNAGSVFMGEFTPESAGDYASGTNHTLPTGGYARAYSGLGLTDFQKRISFQEISEEGLSDLGPAIIRMAEEEELVGHAKAVEIRLSKTTDNLI